MSPSHTELENIITDWVVYMLKLPEKFLLKNQGGGTIVNSITDSIYLSIHAAKKKKMKELNINMNDTEILKFVGYYTEHSFIACEKGFNLTYTYYRRKIPVYYD